MGSRDWTSGSYNHAQFGGGTTAGGDSWAAVTLALRPQSVINLTVSNVDIGSPVIGPVSMTQAHQLGAANVAVGSPVAGPVSMTQAHQLNARMVAVGRPAFSDESGDPFWSDTHLLVRAQGANDSTAFFDESPAARTVVTSGSVWVDTDVDLHGPAISIELGATDWLDVADDLELRASTVGDMTLEAEVILSESGLVTGNNHTIIGKRLSGGAEFTFYCGPSDVPGISLWGPSWFITASGPFALEIGVAHHVAAVRVGTTWTVYVDGVPGTPVDQLGTVSSAASTLKIGYDAANGSRNWQGWMNWVRVTRAARYTAQFDVALPYEMGAYSTGIALAQAHQLVASDLAVSSPVLGAPVLTVATLLTAGNLVVGSPDISTGSELIPNGTFDVDTSGWAPSDGDTTLAVDAGRLSVASVSGGGYAVRTLSGLIVGAWYELNVDFISVSGGANRYILVGTAATGGQQVNLQNASVIVGQNTARFKATQTTHYLSVGTFTGQTALFDNISLKRMDAVLSQKHQITASPLEVGSPVAGPVTLTQKHQLVASPIEVETPDIGTAPNLFTNPTFSAGLTGWSMPAASSYFAASGGQVVITGLPNGGRIEQTITTVVGRRYRISVDVTDYTQGSITGVVSGGPLVGAQTGTGHFEWDFIATATAHNVGVRSRNASVPLTAKIDNLYVRELTATLTQKHQLLASALTVGSPVLGSPALTQLHQLIVSPVAVASPDISTGPELVPALDFNTWSKTGSTDPTINSPTSFTINATGGLVFRGLIAGKAYRLRITYTKLSGSFTLKNGDSAANSDVLVLVTGTDQVADVAFTSTDGAIYIRGVGSGHTVSVSSISIIEQQARLTQRHQITAANLVVSSPVLGLVSLTQKHMLIANDLAVASPVLAAPALTQRHNLIASSVAVGSPVLGSPRLIYLSTPAARRAGPSGASRHGGPIGGSRSGGPIGLSRRASPLG
jgi:hypothetical protein